MTDRIGRAQVLLTLALNQPWVFNLEAVRKDIEEKAAEAGKDPFEYLFEPSIFLLGPDVAAYLERYRPELVNDPSQQGI